MTNLKDGQFQIGGLKFGRGTSISVVGVDQVGYEVTPGDYPIPQSDEVRFRRDYIKPGVIQFGLAVVDNYVLPGFSGSVSQAGSADDTLELFRQEWRADEVRGEWGWVKPLTYRGPGLARILFGRPRNLATDRRKTRPGWYNVTCSYQLSDTLSYSEETTSRAIPVGSSVTISRGDGLAPSWLTFYIQGPITNPKVEFGPLSFTLNMSIPTGDIAVVTALPWERRAVLYRTSGLQENVGWRMTDGSAYLEDLRFPSGASWSAKVTASGAGPGTGVMVGWREAYHAI